VSSTTRQGSSGRIEVKNLMWNAILAKTLNMTWNFSQYFLLLCTVSSRGPIFLSQNVFFHQNLIYVDLLCKSLLVPIQNEENSGSWWQGLACMDFLDFWYLTSRMTI
jgi:hypothetical protein